MYKEQVESTILLIGMIRVSCCFNNPLYTIRKAQELLMLLEGGGLPKLIDCLPCWVAVARAWVMWSSIVVELISDSDVLTKESAKSCGGGRRWQQPVWRTERKKEREK